MVPMNSRIVRLGLVAAAVVVVAVIVLDLRPSSKSGANQADGRPG